MSQEWYIYKSGEQMGPHSWEKLRDLARSGAIQPEDQVWTAGMNGWTAAEDIFGLSDVLRAPAQGPPASPRALPAGSSRSSGPASEGRRWMWVAAGAALAVLLLGGCAAAYLLFLREGAPWATPMEIESTSTPAPTAAPLPSPTESMGWEEPAPTVASGNAELSLQQPDSVVDAFIRATLGTVPGGALDYEAAQALMTEAYAAKYGTPGWVPELYGIQEGPTAYTIDDQQIIEDAATVTASGFWSGELGRRWRFSLEQAAGTWKIADIKVLDAAEGDEETLSGQPTQSTESPSDPPSVVTEAFMLATLGTLPGASLDDSRAKGLMTASYAPEFDSPGFVPLTYGIQDGPTSYEIAEEEISGSTATVTVWGYWRGDLGRLWQFRLERESDAWQIAGIEIIEDGETVQEKPTPSPFWRLNPVTSEFTVSENGGYRLVLTYQSPSEDIEGLFRIAYYRQDDGTLAYDQGRTGVIAVGSTELTLDSDWTDYDLYSLGFRPGAHDVVATIDDLVVATGELTVE